MFSVDTNEEAHAAQIHFCVHRYDGSYAWTDWPRDADEFFDKRLAALEGVTNELRAWWQARPRPEGEA